MKNKKVWSGLASLTFLSIVGGFFLSASNNLLRHWGNDLGFTLQELDKIGGVAFLSSFKLLWAGFLTWSFSFLGRKGRRAWILLMIAIAIVSLIFMRSCDFFGPLFFVALLSLTFASTSYTMMVVASQMDALDKPYWGLAENFTVAGYRIGLSLTSVGLFLSYYKWSWTNIYLLILMLVIFGFVIIWSMPQFDFLDRTPAEKKFSTLWKPFQIWFMQPGAWVVALLMLTFECAEGLIHMQKDFFILSMGFNKEMLGTIKMIGSTIVIAAGFIAGFIIRYRGSLFSLNAAIISQTVAMGGIWASIMMDAKGRLLLIPIFFQYAARGFSMISFYCFQLVSCQVNWSIGHLALMTTLADLGLKLGEVRSGWIVENFGYYGLFGAACLCHGPLLLLVSRVKSVPFIQENMTTRSLKKAKN